MLLMQEGKDNVFLLTHLNYSTHFSVVAQKLEGPLVDFQISRGAFYTQKLLELQKEMLRLNKRNMTTSIGPHRKKKPYNDFLTTK